MKAHYSGTTRLDRLIHRRPHWNYELITMKFRFGVQVLQRRAFRYREVNRHVGCRGFLEKGRGSWSSNPRSSKECIFMPFCHAFCIFICPFFHPSSFLIFMEYFFHPLSYLNFLRNSLCKTGEKFLFSSIFQFKAKECYFCKIAK